MATAREIMTQGAECIGESETMLDAAKKMKELDVGALPICGDDDRLKGMLTDRDIALAVAEGKDPSTKAGEWASADEPVTIGADDDVDQAIDTMKQYKVRRLPVIDEKRLVGIVTQGDVAKNLSDDSRTGDLVEVISAAG